jgi:hypothetical protein
MRMRVYQKTIFNLPYEMHFLKRTETIVLMRMKEMIFPMITMITMMMMAMVVMTVKMAIKIQIFLIKKLQKSKNGLI